MKSAWFCLLLAVLTTLCLATLALNVDKVETITINTVYTPTDVDELIKHLWGNEHTIARAIAMAESHMRPGAVGDNHLIYIGKDGKFYGESYGIFQIRSFEDRPPKELLLDADFNVRYAYSIYKKCGFSAWSAYRNGTYKKFLPVIEPTSAKKEI